MELFAGTSVMSMLIATQQIDTTTSKMVRMKKHACGVHNEALLSRIFGCGFLWPHVVCMILIPCVRIRSLLNQASCDTSVTMMRILFARVRSRRLVGRPAGQPAGVFCRLFFILFYFLAGSVLPPASYFTPHLSRLSGVKVGRLIKTSHLSPQSCLRSHFSPTYL